MAKLSGVGTPSLSSVPHHRPHQRLDLEPVPLLQIVGQRGAHPGLQRPGEGHPPLRRIGGKRNPVCPPHRDDLVHHPR